MSAFVDTSAFLALVVAEDLNHDAAANAWRELLERDETLVTSNYVIVETLALLQRRASIPTINRFVEDILPAVGIEWVDDRLHASGVNSLLMTTKSGPSIVDCVSFAVMRKLRIAEAFTFDRHFEAQGFNLVH